MSETTTVTLTDFLLARIAEREKLAEADHELLCLRIGCETCVFDDDPAAVAQERVCTCGLPALVRAECQAVRRVVNEVSRSPLGKWRNGELSPWALKMLGILAAPYADHEGFREEWRP